MARALSPDELHTRFLLAGLGAVLMVSGCAATPPGQADPLTATTPIQSSQPPAPIATTMPAGSSSSPWTLLGMSADGRRLYLDYGTGDPCSESAGLFVEETTASVTLTASTVVVKSGDNCASRLNSTDGYVDLKSPLGGRALIHDSLQRTG